MQNDLSDRLLEFGVRIIKLSTKVTKSDAGRHITNQLIRSSTSAGANYEEACAAESRADFVHKLQIVLKETRESLYWLRLISKAELVSDESLGKLTQEANELANIIAKSIVTAKKRK